MKTVRLLPTLVIAALLAAGCGKKEISDTSAPPHAHVHTAPHGGTLVEIGEHAYAIEFVRDAAAGKLSAYILDGHAANFVRIAAPSLDIVATLDGGATKTLTLTATANSATGEKAGDTALFEGQADWLKTTPAFAAVIAQLNLRGTSVLNLAFNFPQSNEHP